MSVTTITTQQAQRLYVIANHTGWTKTEVKKTLAEYYKVDLEDFSTKMVRSDDYERFCNYFNNSPLDLLDKGVNLTAFMFGGTVSLVEEINSYENNDSDEQYENNELGLNGGQYRAYLNLQEWWKSGSRQFLLDGKAGTGKTFLIQKFITWIRENTRSTILLTTCWHKALKVLKTYAEDSGIVADCYTIYSALGLQIDYDETGKNQVKQGKIGDLPRIYDYDLIIFDEVGVANREIYQHIQNLFCDRTFKGRFVYMGDVRQLPPINEEKSLFFDACDWSSTLTQVMRFSGPISVLTENAIKSVEQGHLFNVAQLKELADGSVLLFPSKFQFRDLVCDVFSGDEFKSDRNYARLLAFTNDAVNSWVEIIREAIYCDLDELPEYLPGEILVTSAPIKNPVNSKEILLNNGTELTLVNAVPSELEITLDKLYSYSAYDLYFEEIPHVLKIISSESKPFFDRDSTLLAKRAKEGISKSLWGMFYRHKEASAPLQHIYAQTVHKSQGSTYQEVFVVGSDLDKNRKPNEQSRLWYVAASRAKKRLLIG